MAAEMDIKTESCDLPDLGDGIETNTLETNVSFEKELAMELEGVDDDHDGVDIIDSLQDSTENLEANDADSYITGDVEDENFLKKMTSPFVQSQEEGTEEETLYYQGNAEDLEQQYLQDNPEAIQIDDESNDNAPVVDEQNVSVTQVVDGRMIQIGQESDDVPTKSGVTYINKSDLNLLQYPQGVRMVKRPVQATPAKTTASKIFIQNTSKGPVAHRNYVSTPGSSRQEISLSRAKRIGLFSPKLQQVLSTMGPTRLVVKNIPSSSLIKTPAKILPAPLPKLTTVRETMPISVVRTNIPQNQLRTILTTSASPIRPISVTKTVGGLTATKVEGRAPQKLFVRPSSMTSGGIKIPLQIAGKQQVQIVKLINSPNAMSYTTVKPKVQSTGGRSLGSNIILSKSADMMSGKRIFLNMNTDGEKTPLQVRTSTPITFKGKTYTTIKAAPLKEKMPEVVLLDESEPVSDSGSKNDLHADEDGDMDPVSPQQMLEANGIRPKKPCNCTRSQCLKLYCECFANGEFCYQCNCNNCFNNIEHEEERQQSIKSCLDRNPAAFQPKIQMADSDDEERRHNKGCHCKRSHCLKNYCECFEAKLTCGKYCKCMSCRNTEEDLDAWEHGDRNESGEEKTTVKPSPFLPQNVAQALCDCILVQAEESERKGEDIITTEMRIIEELGQRLVQLIGNRTKKDYR